MIICLETSTQVCSVALCDKTGVIGLRESIENKSHASLLTLFVEELLTEAGIRAGDLEAVAVSKGPGSYTGLRIGVSTAKGIAYASEIPLIGVETTVSMFHGIDDKMKGKYETDDTSVFVPMIDARRMEVYYSVISSKGEVLKEVTAGIIDEKSFSNIPENVRILLFGDGAPKCLEIIKRNNVILAEDFRISAAFMYKPVYKSFEERHFEDIAYFEPFYLKDFITSKPRKNLLGR